MNDTSKKARGISAPKGPANAPAPQDRLAMIAEAAYFAAQNRGFEPGHELEDWIAAERGSGPTRRRLICCGFGLAGAAARSLGNYAPIQARLASRSRISSRSTSDFGGAGGGPSAARGFFNRLMALMARNSTIAMMRKSKVVCRKAP